MLIYSVVAAGVLCVDAGMQQQAGGLFAYAFHVSYGVLDSRTTVAIRMPSGGCISLYCLWFLDTGGRI